LRLGASAHRVYAPQVIVPPTLVADDFRETSEEEEVIEYTSIKSSDDTGFFRQYFGEEQAHTLKELANRQTPLATIDWNPTTGAVRGTYLVIPNGPLGPADFLASSFPGATIYAAGNALVITLAALSWVLEDLTIIRSFRTEDPHFPWSCVMPHLTTDSRNLLVMLSMNPCLPRGGVLSLWHIWQLILHYRLTRHTTTRGCFGLLTKHLSVVMTASGFDRARQRKL
jgi:hypothetical protein